MKEWIVEEENAGDLMRGEAIVKGELIRCKDCRWKYKNNCNRAVELFIHDEDFCSWAERRNG